MFTNIINSSIGYIDTDILFTLQGSEINNIIIIGIGIYIYKKNVLNILENSIVYSRRVNITKWATIFGAFGTGVQAWNSSVNKDLRKSRDEAIEKFKLVENKVEEVKREAYEIEIQKQDAMNKLESQKIEIEDLREKIQKLKADSTKGEATSTNNNEFSGSYTRSPNEDSWVDNIFNTIKDLFDSLGELTTIQSYALSNLMFLLVLLASVWTCVIYVLNTYLIHKYKIEDKYPRFYKYLKTYRQLSYYSAILNIGFIIICLIGLISMSILFLFF